MVKFLAVTRVESDGQANHSAVAAIRTALEPPAGVEFIDENGGGAGVRLLKG